jgi:hypothetical protein
MVAKVNVVIRQGGGMGAFGGELPIPSSKIKTSVEVTSGAVAPVVLPGSYVVQANTDIWEITCKGGSIYALFGKTPAPVAAIGTGSMITDGQTRWFAASITGETLSIIDNP